MKAVFLAGGPGSGKDILIGNIFSEFNVEELKIEQILNKKDHFEKDLLISCNSSNYKGVKLCKTFLESLGFDCSMVFVDISNETSKQRLSQRNIKEEKRVKNFKLGKLNQFRFKNLFSNFIRFENDKLLESTDQIKEVYVFCKFFFGFSNEIFEQKKIDTSKFSMKKKLPSSINLPIKVDSVGNQDYSSRDVGFPYPSGGMGGLPSTSVRFESFSTELSDLPSFASDSRIIIPTNSPQNQQNFPSEKIKTIKKVAKQKWRKI